MNMRSGSGVVIVLLFVVALVFGLMDARREKTMTEIEDTPTADNRGNVAPFQATTNIGIEAECSYPRRGEPLRVESIKPTFGKLYELTLCNPSNTNVGAVIAFSGYNFKVGATTYVTTVICRFATNVPPVPLLFADPAPLNKRAITNR